MSSIYPDPASLNADSGPDTSPGSQTNIFQLSNMSLKVHKNENFFGFDFEICTFS
jgi:hypothetical protein